MTMLVSVLLLRLVSAAFVCSARFCAPRFTMTDGGMTSAFPVPQPMSDERHADSVWPYGLPYSRVEKGGARECAALSQLRGRMFLGTGICSMWLNAER